MDARAVPEQGTVTAPESPGSASRVLLRIALRVGLGVGVIGTIGGFAYGLSQHGMDTEFHPALTAWVFVSCILALGCLTGIQTSDRDARVSEGRERVREAEEDLERALRPSPLGRVGTVVVHGDLVLPGTDEPSPIRPAPSGLGDPLANGATSGEGMAPTRDGARLTLSELWAVTHRRLDLYHEIALGQAARSFRNAQIAMVLGFALLVGFVLVALEASTTAGSVVAGGLGAVAAGLAGYVSRTFIRSQEASAAHLRAYFDQPLEFSRYLAAERLIADAGLSEDRRSEVLAALVEAMVAGDSQPKADGAGSSGDNGTS